MKLEEKACNLILIVYFNCDLQYVFLSFLIVVAVNAISYVNGRAFHDNNMQYVQICNFLKSIMPAEWEFEVENNTFFNPEDGTENYVHGKLM